MQQTLSEPLTARGRTDSAEREASSGEIASLPFGSSRKSESSVAQVDAAGGSWARAILLYPKQGPLTE